MQMLRRLKEDMVAGADSAPAIGAGDMTSPGDAPPAAPDVTPHAAVPTCDYSVLGHPKNGKGFFGPNDFIIPKNVLSGDYSGKPKVLKRFG